MRGLLDKALAAAGWDALQDELRARRAAGEAVGAGLALFVEKSGLGPFDGVRVTVDTSGAVEVVTGAASVGQGMETVIAQICADALGVDYRRIRVVHGQTDRIAFGMGAFASRVTVMTGEATRHRGGKTARQGDRRRGRPAAIAARYARHRRRRGGEQKVGAGPLDRARRRGAGAGAGLKTARRRAAWAVRRRLVRVRPHDLSVRRAFRGGARRSRHRRRRGRALSGCLRRRQSGQSDAGRRPDRGRHGARHRRRALRGISLRRARRAAQRQFRRLPHADGARNPPSSRS